MTLLRLCLVSLCGQEIACKSVQLAMVRADDRQHHRIAGISLGPKLPNCCRKAVVARLIASGTVKMLRIGRSAAKPLSDIVHMGNVQRLSGGGPGHITSWLKI